MTGPRRRIRVPAHPSGPGSVPGPALVGAHRTIPRPRVDIMRPRLRVDRRTPRLRRPVRRTIPPRTGRTAAAADPRPEERDRCPHQQEASVAVELRGITKRFPGVVANRDIELRVARGEVHAIVGENGAGKSTLMKILYGMHRPDEGTILLDGARGRLPSPGRRDRGRHRHGAPALHAGRQLHRPGEHRPRQRADAGSGLDRAEARDRDPRDLRPLRPRPRPRRAGRGPRRRRPAARRDRQGALPGATHADPRRADGRAGAAGGRRALRQPARAQARGPDRHLHLAQARRGAQGRRLDHRHPPRHHRRRGRPEDDDRRASSPR